MTAEKIASAPHSRYFAQMSHAFSLPRPDAVIRAKENSPRQISGFGALMGAERAPGELAASATTRTQGNPTEDLGQISRHHDRQIEATMELIERRQDELPQAGRFHRASFPQVQEAPVVAWASPKSEVVPQLIAFHVRFARTISALIASGRGETGAELLLKEATQGHENLAWILNGLLREDTRERFPAMGTSRPENEGRARLFSDRAVSAASASRN